MQDITITQSVPPNSDVRLQNGPTANNTGIHGEVAEIGNFGIPFKITAGARDVYISKWATRMEVPSGSGNGVTWALTDTSTAPADANHGMYSSLGGQICYPYNPYLCNSITAVSGDTPSAYKIAGGTSRYFTLMVHVPRPAVSIPKMGIRITGINYSFSPTMGSLYYTSDLSAFKTKDIAINRTRNN